MIKTWIRILYVTFYNEDNTYSVTIGKTTDDSKKPAIVVTGNKYLSLVKDNFSIKIYNLPYKNLIDIMERKLLRVKIFAGYLNNQNPNSFEGKKIFDGGVINIVNDKQEWRDNVATFVCASRLVAKAQEWRCNLTFASGINLYSAINYIGTRAGMVNMNISDDFKYRFRSAVSSAESTPVNYLDQISNEDNQYFFNSDSSEDSDITAVNVGNRALRIIDIDADKGMIIGAAPELTSNGLTWYSLPVYNYMPGDLCHIDNSLLNVSFGTDSFSGSQGTPNAVYMSRQGYYYIFDLSYNLSNTNGQFMVKLHCKSKDLFDNVTSGR